MKFKAWLKLARLQFYAFPAIAVFAGAKLAATSLSRELELAIFFLTVLGTLLVEFITVITNEIHDLATDRINQNAGAFTGGSRVLANGSLTIQQVCRGRIMALCLLGVVVITVATLVPTRSGALSVVLGVGLLLGIGYTAPPLKLAYRGFGELTVALTHSALVILAGFISQGGAWEDPVAWEVIWPLFFAILPSIILGGIPDSAADRTVGKLTVAVRAGPRWAAAIAGICAAVAAAHYLISAVPFFSLLTMALVTHLAWLEVRLIQLWRNAKIMRADGLIVLALSFVLWFVIGPVVQNL